MSSQNLPGYLLDLNERQRAGVEATDGPVLVIAGAGSGKTKMLTARIIHLMSHCQVPAHNILAVTFTNKAAGEMRERVSRALGLAPDALNPPPPWFRGSAALSQPVIGTFHSICVRLLRREMEFTPYSQQFTIYDDSDQLSLIKDCFTQLNLSEKMFSPKSFQHGINAAKCAALEPGGLQADAFNLHAKNLARVYELYQKELYRNNAIDFGEIITLTYRILRDNPELLKKYQQLYRYIHVDEYQDTNRAQYLLIQLLANSHRNLCVVGDEDQSIYKWRGADIRNILDFERDYPESEVVKLEQNYRSTQTIINASSRLIANNTERKAKTLWTSNEVGERIRRFQVSDDRGEAELVVENLKRECQESGYAFSDVAIFYRTNAQSRVLEDVLRREKVPYKIIGGLRFYDRKEIKDVIAYFRVLVNGTDSISFKRIINVPQRSIGKTTVDKVESLAFEKRISFEEALREAAGPESAAVTGGPKRKLGEFLSLFDELRGLLATKSLSEFYHELIDRTRYVEELREENTEESLSRIENLQEFDSILIEFEEAQEEAARQVAGAGDPLTETPPAGTLLPLFLESVTLAAEKEQGESEAGNVSLMTLHTSKGLEFPLVFVVGMEEGLFPSIRSYEDENEEDIEEERRLCYVGMTRAKRKLYLTHAVCRRVYGNIVYHEPSRFFAELPEELVEFTDLSRFRMPATGFGRSRDFDDEDVPERTYSSRPAPLPQHTHLQAAQTGGRATGATGLPAGLNVGRRVRHETYGVGVVRGIEGATADAKVTIEFAGRVTKKFILKFANLEYING